MIVIIPREMVVDQGDGAVTWDLENLTVAQVRDLQYACLVTLGETEDDSLMGSVNLFPIEEGAK